jgi:hypothetical protein
MKRFEEHKQEKRRRPVTFDYFIDHVYVSARALLAVRVLGRHAPPRPQSLESCTNSGSPRNPFRNYNSFYPLKQLLPKRLGTGPQANSQPHAPR